MPANSRAPKERLRPSRDERRASEVAFKPSGATKRQNSKTVPSQSSKAASSKMTEARKTEARKTEAKKTEARKGTPSKTSAVHTKPAKKKRRGFLRRHVKGIALLVLGPPLAAVAWLFWYASTIPLPPDTLSTQTTFVFTSTGEELASFKADTDRTNIDLVNIPPVMLNAVLASEDKSFYSHSGVDPFGIARAVYRDLRNDGVQQGGSTLTQQYVKITYTGRERSYKRKLREAILAVKLERKLSKEEIFERYLNAVYFGRGATGVQAAARAYFEKDASQLTLPEAAYLAGVLRAPENTDARRNPERAKFRRDSVLTNMTELGFITESERFAASGVPLTGVGGIVRARPTSTVEFADAGTQYAVDMVRRELIQRFGAAKVFGGGLRVKTTLDIATQRRAREVLFGDVLNRAGDPDGAMVVLDHDGQMLAVVGGKNWDVSQVNLAAGRGFGGPGRQAGSTFKPFVLAAAVREGIAVATPFPAPNQVVIPEANIDGTDWEVSNFDNVGYEGDIDLITATANSVNTVYAQLIVDERVGAEKVVEMAKALGIRSPLEPYPAIALGTEEVSPLEMADAYLTFARQGSRVEPFLITQVTDASGQVLYEPQRDQVRVLTTNEAAIINQTLAAVVEQGSGVKAKLVDQRPVAGKTGTTQNARDAWFVGYTPQDCCVVAIWMGYADTNTPMTSFRGSRVTGGAVPADIFSRFMNKQLAGSEPSAFEPPDNDELGEVITPKPASKPVPKKRRKSTVADTVADTTSPSESDSGGEVAPDTSRPPVEPVPADGSTGADQPPPSSGDDPGAPVEVVTPPPVQEPTPPPPTAPPVPPVTQPPEPPPPVPDPPAQPAPE
jgi:membrane peptidoglycan carboxypeptidase